VLTKNTILNNKITEDNLHQGDLPEPMLLQLFKLMMLSELTDVSSTDGGSIVDLVAAPSLTR